jgi:enamine deaminase RidA (YjgF/YER057c/UK114 family)
MAQLNVYDKLKELGIELPTAGAPAAAYVMSAQSGNTVYLSGHIAKKDGKVWAGKLGATLTTEEGRAAARSIAIDLIATLHAHVGDLNKVTRIVKVMSLVNSTLEFTEQRRVGINRRCIWRARQTRTLGIWRGADSAGCVRRNRIDCRSRLKSLL